MMEYEGIKILENCQEDKSKPIKKFEKIDVNGETYYIKNENANHLILDSHFIQLCTEEASGVIKEYFKSKDFNNMFFEELKSYIMLAKNSAAYNECIDLCNIVIDHGDILQIRNILPVVTSVIRTTLGNKEAIDYYLQVLKKFGYEIESAPLLTSVGFAYYYEEEYDLAKECADRAYAIQGGCAGYFSELSKLYEMIKTKI